MSKKEDDIKKYDQTIYNKLIESFNAGEWHFQNNEFWVRGFDGASFSKKAGNRQYDFNFFNEDLKIYLKFTTQKNNEDNKYKPGFEKFRDLKTHYKLSTSKLAEAFKTDILNGESYMNYFYIEENGDIVYKKLFINFTWLERRKLAKAYRNLLKKSLIKFSGGTTSLEYMEKNKQLFRESRLSNLLDD